MSEPVQAEQVARKQFSVSFRGFDQHEVRAYLARVAGELSAWEEREQTMRARLAELEQRPKDLTEIDEDAIEAALGETATRIIHAAREAAAEVRARADAEAATKLDEAESTLARSTADAAEANAALRADTEQAMAALRADAERTAASLVADARAEAASLVDDASATRDRTLRDLADRRSVIVGEIEQLQAARDRLRAAHDAVRGALDVALLDVEAAEMRAADVLARVKPLDVTPPDAADAAGVPADDEVVELSPADDSSAPSGEATEPVDSTSTEPPESEADARTDDESSSADDDSSTPEPDDRRSSALRLLRPTRTEAEGTPTAPPIDDPYEGVRIIRPETVDDVVEESSADAADASEAPGDAPDAVQRDEPVADDELDTADGDHDHDEVVEDETVDVEASANAHDGADGDAPNAEIEPGPEAEVTVDVTSAGGDAPVDDLFARLRAGRAEKVARATAVLAATDPSPVEPDEAVEQVAAAPTSDVADASPDAALLAARDASVADAERAVLRSLKRALADEQNEVLDTLRRLRGAPTVDALLPDVAVHEARYDAVLGTGAAAAAAAGGELAGGGGDASGVTAEIGRAVAADLRSRVARSIDEASGDVDTLAEGISATYREWKTARSEPLARDVITAAFASGTYIAASGELRWVVDPDEGGCPDCEDNALAGSTAKGTSFPTGQLHPPAHAGCRCALVPVS